MLISTFWCGVWFRLVVMDALLTATFIYLPIWRFQSVWYIKNGGSSGNNSLLLSLSLINSFLCWYIIYVLPEMCSERDRPLKYRRTHAKLARLAGSGQLVWATGCELSLTLGGLRDRKQHFGWSCRAKRGPPDHTRVNWPVDASASRSAPVGPGGRHRWAARDQVGREPARQKAREGYPSHYTSLVLPKARSCFLRE